MNCLDNRGRTPFTWWKAIRLAVAALYAPFIIMTIYAQLCVACSHCKKATLEILPVAPGLVPGWLIRTQLLHGWPQSAAWIVSAMLILVFIIGLSLVIRRGGPVWKWTATIIALGIFTWLAVGTLALIRA